MSLNQTWIEISGRGLCENLATFRSVLSPGAKLLVVVKSNAYGHDLEIASKALAADADWFGVDALDEAVTVANAVRNKPILILGYSSGEQADLIVEFGFRQVVYRFDTIEALSASAVKLEKPARLHLKIETGTNRQGVPISELAEFARAAAALPGIEIEGVSTHFANIEDTLDPTFAQRQLRRFQGALEILESEGVRPPEIHAAATAGILLYPDTHFTMVRLGIGAYGVWPSRETRIAARERGRAVSLQPALAWKTRIVQLKRIETGEYVGYGLAFQAGRPTTLALIPVGYYEGYDRRLSGTGRALVRGRAVPIVGRVAMNMTMLDVTDVNPQLDEEVVLLGRQRDVEISADELADKVGTIPYEILSRINPLLERRLV